MKHSKKKIKLTPAEEEYIASGQWDRYTRARDHGHIDYIDMAKKCDRFYRGEQWDIDDVTML